MAGLASKIESLLFVAGKPLTAKKIGELAETKEKDAEDALRELQREYLDRRSGIQLFSTGKTGQLGTAGNNSAVVEKFVKEEFAGELTRPQLETLTVIAYRGLISKGELEIIRGVSCGVILRNLMIRGLIDEEFDGKIKQSKYRISMEFARHLGLPSIEALPGYASLHSHEVIQTLMSQQSTKADEAKTE